MKCQAPLPACDRAAEFLVVVIERPAVGRDDDTKELIYGPERETARAYCPGHVEEQITRLDPLPVEVEVFQLVDWSRKAAAR